MVIKTENAELNKQKNKVGKKKMKLERIEAITKRKNLKSAQSEAHIDKEQILLLKDKNGEDAK